MKVLLIGDTHHGEQGDSTRYNEQLISLYEWVIKNYKGKVDKVVHLGDFFHNRAKVQVNTLEYGVRGAKLLGNAFGKDNTLFITGNHDLFYSDRLDTTSLRSIEPYVTLINKGTSMGNCWITPWIIDDKQWDETCDAGKDHDYLFAHLELRGFKMNDHYTMEHGQSHKELRDYTKVFTGHFHSYQEVDNIIYAGTPLPITFNEANEDHGVWLLDTDTGEYEFIVYDKVKVISVPYDNLDAIADCDPENTKVRVEFPDDLEDENLISEISDILSEFNFTETKMKYKGNKAKKLLEQEADEVDEVENIDGSVVSFIRTSKEVESIRKNLLEELYEEARKRSEVK